MKKLIFTALLLCFPARSTLAQAVRPQYYDPVSGFYQAGGTSNFLSGYKQGNSYSMWGPHPMYNPYMRGPSPYMNRNRSRFYYNGTSYPTPSLRILNNGMMYPQ